MDQFTITVYSPRNQIEFDERFKTEETAPLDNYLLKLR